MDKGTQGWRSQPRERYGDALEGGGVSEQYNIDAVLTRQRELIVPVRGHDFILYREFDGAVICRIGHERKRFVGCTLDEIKADLEEWREGRWIP
jgi:hypothetical protein